MTEPYAWIAPYVEEVQNALGLNAWIIKVVHADDLPSDDGTADATCTPNWQRLQATITIRNACWLDHFAEPYVGSKVLLCHELLHVADAGVAHVAIEQIANTFIKHKHRQTAFHIYTEHDEHRVARLAPRLYELVEDRIELRQVRAELKALKRRPKASD